MKLLNLSDNQSLLFILTCPWQETGWNAATSWSFCRVVRDIDLLTWDVTMGEVFQHPEWRHLLKNSFTLFRRRRKKLFKTDFSVRDYFGNFRSRGVSKKAQDQKSLNKCFFGFSHFLEIKFWLFSSFQFRIEIQSFNQNIKLFNRGPKILIKNIPIMKLPQS